MEQIQKDRELKIGYMTLGTCATNCFYIQGKNSDGADTKEVLLVDPADRGDYIVQKLQEQGLHVIAILLTHGHFDHILGLQDVKRLSGAKVYALENEKSLLENTRLNLSEVMGGQACSADADIWLRDGEELMLGGITLKVIATPGHTAGSCCYYIPAYQKLISGDTLFQESIGRTDFPTGSTSDLIHSLKEKLFILPDDVQVYPGHGECTTIGYEKKYNPYA